MTTKVVSIETGRLRRDLRSGEPLRVLEVVERVLSDPTTPVGREEAVDAFYATFWVIVEDEALSHRAGALDLRIEREASR